MNSSLTIQKSLLFSFSTFAQNDTLVLSVGDKLIDGTIIKPYTNKWKLTIVSGKGNSRPNGIWTDHGQIIELNGIKYFHRVQDLYDANMNLTDTWINRVELNTLKPLSFQTINPNGGFSFYKFYDKKVKIITNLNNEKTTIESEAKLVSEVFDWNLYGMLLAGLPLKKGMIMKLPFYNNKISKQQWLTTYVEGTEKIKVGDKNLLTWKIITNQKLVFWMSKKSPYVIKLTLDIGNNSYILWEAF